MKVRSSVVRLTNQYVPRERHTSTRASPPVYHSVSRKRTESSMLLPCQARIGRRNRRSRFRFVAVVSTLRRGRHGVARAGIAARRRRSEHVSGAAPRVNQRLGGGLIDFPAQSIYVHFDGIGEWIEALVPHMLGNLFAPDHAAGVARQIFQ